MFSTIISKLNPYAYYVKAALILMALVYIGWLNSEIGYNKRKLGEAQGTIEKQKGEMQKWASAYDVLARKTKEQNQAIEALKVAQTHAKSRADTAIKKARLIAQHRQDQINASYKNTNHIKTCDEAVKKAKSDLIGSAL